MSVLTNDGILRTTPMDERREAGYKRLPLLKSSLALSSQSQVQKAGHQGSGDQILGHAKPNMILIQNQSRKKMSNQNAVLHCKYHSGLPNYQRSDRSTGNAIGLIASAAGGSSHMAHWCYSGRTVGPSFCDTSESQTLFLKSACSKFITS